MKELYKISFLSTLDCFFFLNEKNLRQVSIDDRSNNCIKIEFGENFSAFTYSFLCTRPNNVVNDNHIGVNSYYAQLLGLSEGDEVLISKANCQSLSRVNVVPQDDKHFDLILKNYELLENVILNQVRIVAKGQVIPIHVVGNITVSLKIKSLHPELPYGQLQECTELVVESPTDIHNTNIKKADKLTKSVNDGSSFREKNIETGLLNFGKSHIQKPNETNMDVNKSDDWSIKELFSSSYAKIFKKLGKTGTSQDSVLNEQDHYLYKMIANNKNCIYKVKSALAMDKAFPEEVRNKYIYTKRLPVSKSVDGPCCFKIFCKVKKIEEKLEILPFGGSFNFFTFAYVVNLSDDEDALNNDIYCPDSIMRALNLKIGSYIQIEEVKRTVESKNENRSNAYVTTEMRESRCDIFTDGMKSLYKNVTDTIVNNMKYNQKINTVIIGGTGTGKSHILDSLTFYFQQNLMFCRKIDCKMLRKVKMSNVIKLFTEKLTECFKFQPSVLMIDDLDALLIEEEEENRYSEMYSETIGNLLTSLLSSYQKINDITFVATISSLSKLKHVSTDRGPIMFENICEIGELDSTERKEILKHLISQRYPKCSPTFVDDISDKTKGYNIQDLCDLVEIAAFKSLTRNNSGSHTLEEIDFESALAEKVPLSLYGVNLRKNSQTKWDDVGGMEGPKILLKEMFDWPLRYREIYMSCPLRLQCGVLLYGAPGTGKTLLASAVADECGLNFISVKGPEIFSKYVGASEQGIRDLFLRARKARPCLLFFDEFDSLVPRRGSSNEDVNDRVVNQMLTELDGVEELTEVFILAATSRPDLLDPALLRPGRIDKAVHCGLPGKEERLSILKVLSKHLRLSGDVDLEEIASETDGYTGADLQAIMYSAQTSLVKEIGKEYNVENNDIFELKRSHLLTGLAETKPSISKEDKQKYQMIYDNFIASRMGGVLEKSTEAFQKIMFA